MINAMQMRSLLPREEKLSDKIKKVAAAAAEILPDIQRKDKIKTVGPSLPGVEDWDDDADATTENAAAVGPKRSMWDVEEEQEKPPEVPKKDKKDKKDKKEKMDSSDADSKENNGRRRKKTKKANGD